MFSIKNSKILWVVLVLMGVIILGIIIFYILKSKSNYVAVFLNNGFVYFGKLSTFPRLKLVNPIFIQVDQSGNPLIQRFSDAFWHPQGFIYLNKQNIAFIAPIKNTSPLISFIESALTLPLTQQSPAVPSQPQLPLIPQSQQQPQQPQLQFTQPTEVIQESTE